MVLGADAGQGGRDGEQRDELERARPDLGEADGRGGGGRDERRQLKPARLPGAGLARWRCRLDPFAGTAAEVHPHTPYIPHKGRQRRYVGHLVVVAIAGGWRRRADADCQARSRISRYGGGPGGGRRDLGGGPGGGGVDQEQRRVVVERGADVLVQVGADQVEQALALALAAADAGHRLEYRLARGLAARRLGGEDADPLGQRVERPLGVARLGDAVGVEEKLVIRLQGVDELRGGAVAEGEQAERRRGRRHLQEGHAPGRGVVAGRRDQQRRRVTAVEDRGPPRFRVDLDEQRGDELLVPPQAPAEPRVQAGRELGERARVVRLLAEHAEHVGRELDRAEALAAHVAHDHPDAVLRWSRRPRTGRRPPSPPRRRRRTRRRSRAGRGAGAAAAARRAAPPPRRT